MTWEDAFFAQYQDACTGRLVRGIVHNLNGVNQAFALQSELFKTFFSQAMNLLAEAETGSGDACRSLKELVRKRAAMVEQMEEKLRFSSNIVRRILPLMDMYAADSFPGVEPARVVRIEDDFLCADPFFKHKVQRCFDFPHGLPLLVASACPAHFVLHHLLVNAADAVRECQEGARITVTAGMEGDHLVFRVEDNGPGVPPGAERDIFAPFVTFREGKMGIGLYAARKAARAAGGDVALVPGAEKGACFEFRLPQGAL